MSWEKQHGEVIKDFLRYLNKQSDCFILRGGTALKLCYRLDRFSEDIDLDVKLKAELSKYIHQYVKKRSYEVRIAKDTNLKFRCFINYGNDNKPLKVDSFAGFSSISDDLLIMKNGILTYKIDRLAQQKAEAYLGRDRIRDLYDITFICKNYYSELSEPTLNFIRDVISRKGLEQFDYLIENQEDNLINKDKLANDFLEIYDKLGLIKEEIVKNTRVRHPSQGLEPKAPSMSTQGRSPEK